MATISDILNDIHDGDIDVKVTLDGETISGTVGITEKTLSQATGTVSSSGDNEVIAAPGASTRIVVVKALIQNESETKTLVLVKSGSTTKRRLLLKGEYGFGALLEFDPGREWGLGANEALKLNLDGANQVGYTIDYYTEST